MIMATCGFSFTIPRYYSAPIEHLDGFTSDFEATGSGHESAPESPSDEGLSGA